MSQVKPKKLTTVNTKDFLAGIQALNIFYEEKTNAFIEFKEQYGENHPVVEQLLEELNTLSDLLNFFSSLAGDQLQNGGDHYN